MDCAIIGAGGHAKIVADILELNGYKIKGYYDDNATHSKILGKINEIDGKYSGYICAIGNNHVRKKITKKYAHLNWITAIHPSAIISKSAIIKEGSMICAGTIIQSDVIIGKHVIINTKASVDHDCIVDRWTHICPNVTLCGTVKVGECTMICSSSTALPNTCIGRYTTIGACSLVLNDIGNNVTVCGIPAKRYLSN